MRTAVLLTLVAFLASCKKDDPKPDMFDEMTLRYTVTASDDGPARIRAYDNTTYDYHDEVVYFDPDTWVNSKQGLETWEWESQAKPGDMAQIIILPSYITWLNITVTLSNGDCERVIFKDKRDGNSNFDMRIEPLEESMFYKCDR